MTISEDVSAAITGEGQVMRTRIVTPWEQNKANIMQHFGLTSEEADKYEHIEKEDLIQAYAMMQLSRQFETACNQQYMQVRSVQICARHALSGALCCGLSACTSWKCGADVALGSRVTSADSCIWTTARRPSRRLSLTLSRW